MDEYIEINMGTHIVRMKRDFFYKTMIKALEKTKKKQATEKKKGKTK